MYLSRCAVSWQDRVCSGFLRLILYGLKKAWCWGALGSWHSLSLVWRAQQQKGGHFRGSWIPRISSVARDVLPLTQCKQKRWAAGQNRLSHPLLHEQAAPQEWRLMPSPGSLHYRIIECCAICAWRFSLSVHPHSVHTFRPVTYVHRYRDATSEAQGKIRDGFNMY